MGATSSPWVVCVSFGDIVRRANSLLKGISAKSGVSVLNVLSNVRYIIQVLIAQSKLSCPMLLTNGGVGRIHGDEE